MKDDASKFNTPETYAKFGKIQRQIVQKEKVLMIMVKESKLEVKEEQIPAPQIEQKS